MKDHELNDALIAFLISRTRPPMGARAKLLDSTAIFNREEFVSNMTMPIPLSSAARIPCRKPKASAWSASRR
jgi:hypothetical protein